VALTLDHLQLREEHWAIVDLVGKGGHIRADPVSLGARFGANNRTLPWLQAADSISRE
jgi:hypothetical protein